MKTCSECYSPIMRTRDDWLQILEDVRGGHLHAGPLAATFDSSIEFVERLASHGMLREHDRVLDLGCGNGRIAIALAEKSISYVGLDVIKESVDFCRKAFEPYGFAFYHLDVRNPFYNPSGSLEPTDVRLPFPDASFDLVIAESLFTHLERPAACWRYVSEVRRILKPDGRFFSSWFCDPPNAVHRGADRTVLPREDIQAMLHHFTILRHWGGETTGFHDQWKVEAMLSPV